MKDLKKEALNKTNNDNEVIGVVNGAELTDEMIEKVSGGVVETQTKPGSNCD